MIPGAAHNRPHDLELGSGPKGCFLIHGFAGTTEDVRELATFLADHGYRVSAKLLAGHGTSIEECNLVRAEDWLEELEYHFTEFLLEQETTFVIGLEMGAALALHLAALYPVAGVVAISLELGGRRAHPSWLLSVLAPFVSTVARSEPRAEQGSRDTPFNGYDRYPIKGLRAMFRLYRYIRAELHQVTAPTLLTQSNGDSGKSKAAAQLVLDTLPARHKRLRIYESAKGYSTNGSGRAKVQADILDFLLSHTAA